ncbi:MAG: putative NADP-dependent oxidoreductase yfmJ [Subtercola sp.]|jgi:NADPH-dependent curcumin reductase CurA|nr:putative NADP-dependent oxidoreductase yfmJ [Subtercola sp.]
MTDPATVTAPAAIRACTLARHPNGLPVAGDFAIVETPYNGLAPNQLLVKNEWFSVEAVLRRRLDPGDSPYLAPFSIGDTLDGWAVGRVVESRAAGFDVGSYVFHYHGWRDYGVLTAVEPSWTSPRVIPVDHVQKPEYFLGALGPSGLTSWAGLLLVGQLAENDVVYVSAAAGAIGGLAVQIAKLKGHRVVASVGSDEKAAFVVDVLGADAAFNYRTEGLTAGLARVAPDGIDLYFDNVGGEHLAAALEVLRPGGRVALCGAVSTYNTAEADQPGVKNLFKAIEQGLTLRGFLARMYHDRLPDMRADISAWLADGRLVYPENVVEGLDEAPGAFIGMLEGRNIGKTLVHL